jgi:hypothetical protein
MTVEVFEKSKTQLESATSCRFIEKLKIESDRFNVSLTFKYQTRVWLRLSHNHGNRDVFSQTRLSMSPDGERKVQRFHEQIESLTNRNLCSRSDQESSLERKTFSNEPTLITQNPTALNFPPF